jgi:peptidoglycan-associated lipoprotein
MSSARISLAILSTVLTVTVACGGNPPPVAKPTNPPQGSGSSGSSMASNPSSGAERPPAPPVVPSGDTGIKGDPFAGESPEAVNQHSPLKPIFFAYDSDALDDTARQALSDNAQVLKRYATWVVTIEGHCDERGTAEYNLALGERRALVAKTYLLSLGVGTDRLRTVSYGKEFPFDPGHAESSWTQNRRDQFMLTSK